MSSNYKISLIVVLYNMAREAPRTLFTMSSAYQRGVSSDEYEVIVVDAGSSHPVTSEFVAGFGPNFRLMRFDAAPSPVVAINRAAATASGAAIALCIDGARMLSPGILRLMIDAFKVCNDPVVATLAWHLGPKIQNESMLEGYGQKVEDELLTSIDWRADGYELFRVASLALSSKSGWFRPIAESNCLAVQKDSWNKMRGLHEGFISKGGGLVNLDFYREACERLDSLVVLLGEGTFHQFHGGVATNVPMECHPRAQYLEEYAKIRGRTFARPVKQALYFGEMPQQAIRFLQPSGSVN